MAQEADLTRIQFGILNELFQGGALRSAPFRAGDLEALRSRGLITDLGTERIRITERGEDALLPRPPVGRSRPVGHTAANGKPRSNDSLQPLSPIARQTLGKVDQAGGKLDLKSLDGRVVRGLVRMGLLTQKQDTVSLTEAGRKRLPSAATSPHSPPPPTNKPLGIAPYPRPPRPEPMQAEPTAGSPVEAEVDARADSLNDTPMVDQEVMGAIRRVEEFNPPNDTDGDPEPAIDRRLQTIVESLEQDLASSDNGDAETVDKARLLDLLMARSPAIRGAYEAYRSLGQALGRLDGV